MGLTIWPFIFLKEGSLREDGVLINHERIHLRQQLELLVVPFYIFYFLEWFLRTVWYLDAYRAYQNLSFEREAYQHEKDMDYLKKRKFFAFLNYF